MKLSELAKKPQLVEVTLSDTDIITQYGEPLTFWTWDRQPIDVFLKLAAVEDGNYATIMSAVSCLILTETGSPVLEDGATLPTPVMMAVVGRVVRDLGKLPQQS